MIKITPAEFILLEILWEESPLSAREVFERRNREGSLQTVRTLLERLEGKKLIQRSDYHGIAVYAPLAKRGDVLAERQKDFLERYFGGNPVEGAAAFLSNAKLSGDELDFLRRLLDKKRKESRHDD